MSTKYTVRVASPVAYEYWEAESDSYEGLLEAEQLLREHRAEAAGDVTPAQGEANVKSSFGKTTEQKPAFGGGSSAFGGGNKGRQESNGDNRDLGEHEGYKLSVWKGKFGWCFNAYNPNANPKKLYADLERNQDPATVTLDDAIEAIRKKLAA